MVFISYYSSALNQHMCLQFILKNDSCIVEVNDMHAGDLVMQ